MTFEAELTRVHLAQLFAQVTARARSHQSTTWPTVGFLAVAIVVILGLLQLAGWVARPIDRTAWIGPGELVVIAFIGGILLTVEFWRLLSRRMNADYAQRMLRDGGSQLGRRRYDLNDVGVTMTGAHGTYTTLWSVISEVTEAENTYLLWTDPGAALMVPKSAFDSASAHAAFKVFVSRRIGAPAS